MAKSKQCGPTYEFECEFHGPFEQIWCEVGQPSEKCPECGEDSPRVWITPPQIDSFAASLWNTPYKDTTRINENLKRTGRFIKEPGVDEECKRNNENYLKKKKEAFAKKVEKWIAEKPIEHIQKAIKVDAELLSAQERGDVGKLKQMGAVTSMKEAYKVAEEAKPLIKERTDVARKSSNRGVNPTGTNSTRSS